MSLILVSKFMFFPANDICMKEKTFGTNSKFNYFTLCIKCFVLEHFFLNRNSLVCSLLTTYAFLNGLKFYKF